MLDKITTALIAVVFAAIMTWCFLSPFLVPQLYIREGFGRPSAAVVATSSAVVSSTFKTSRYLFAELRKICAQAAGAGG
jgi:hypothetical protein